MILLMLISRALILTGAIFALITGIAMLRFPDFYSRLHAVTKGLIGGVLLIIIGLIIQRGFSSASGRLLGLMILLLITSPVVSHTLARAAYHYGYRPDSLIHDDLHSIQETDDGGGDQR